MGEAWLPACLTPSVRSWGHCPPSGPSGRPVQPPPRPCIPGFGASPSCGTVWCLCRAYRNKGRGPIRGWQNSPCPAEGTPGNDSALSPRAWLHFPGQGGCDPAGVLKSCLHAAVSSCSPTATPRGQTPSSPGPVFGVQAWGAAAWPGAVPPRVPGPVPARGQRGRSNDPLFPAGTQRTPVRPAGASGGAGGARQRGGPWHLPRAGVSWGWPCWGSEAAVLVTALCRSPRTGGAHLLRGTLPPPRTPQTPSQGLRG